MTGVALDTSASRIEWLIAIDPQASIKRHTRKSSIIGTIGPKSNSVEVITNLRRGK